MRNRYTVNSNFGMIRGGSLTRVANSALALQASNSDIKFVMFIYKKLKSKSSEFLDKLSTLNIPEIRRKVMVETLIYVNYIRDLYFDLRDRLVSGKGLQARQNEKNLRIRSKQGIDRITNSMRANLFGKSFRIFRFGIFRDQDPEIVLFYTTQREIADISKIVNLSLWKIEAHIDAIRDDTEFLMKMVASEIDELISDIFGVWNTPAATIAMI